VLVNPSGQNGIEVACAREERLMLALGEDPEYANARVERLRKILLIAQAPERAFELHEALAEDVRAYSNALRGMGTPLTKDQVTMWAASRTEMMNRTIFRSGLTTDPAEAYTRVACPVLVLSGGLDMVIPQDVQLPHVRAALSASASTRVEVKELARMNHWMQPATTGFDDEMDLIETTVSEDALAEILAFLASVKAP
jgi:pimeloyl-ACP methyl ester carboxylesterase